ncbi:MAG: Sec-independent protein translocase protein TatB [Acidobacteriota bacterium]
MFGSIGVPELILIFVIALLLFGPKKLPDIGRSLGKALGEFKRASNDLKRSLEEEVAADELRQVRTEVREATSTVPADAKALSAPGDAVPAESKPPSDSADPPRSAPVEPK